jgi:hypothetical protein
VWLRRISPSYDTVTVDPNVLNIYENMSSSLQIVHVHLRADKMPQSTSELTEEEIRIVEGVHDKS